MLQIKDKGVPCGICHEALSNDVPEGSRYEPVATQCNLEKLQHVFHRECLEKWRAVPRPEAQTCPLCRINPTELINAELVRRIVAKEVAADRRNCCRCARWRKAINERLMPLTRWRRQRAGRLRAVATLLFFALIVWLFFWATQQQQAATLESFDRTRVIRKRSEEL
jgi:hypothetical protein